MKIHSDKIESGPPHALSVQNIRVILNAVPPNWTEGIKEVHLSNSLEWRGLACAIFSRYSGCLTIYSRKVTTEVALDSALSELAAISLRLDRGLRRRPKAIRDRLTKMIAPLRHTLLPLVGSKPDIRGHICLDGFRELRFAPFPKESEHE
jgi:hypothetical protein